MMHGQPNIKKSLYKVNSDPYSQVPANGHSPLPDKSTPHSINPMHVLSFRNMLVSYAENLPATCRIPKLQDHLFSTVRDSYPPYPEEVVFTAMR
jgi:hypothetical protein